MLDHLSIRVKEVRHIQFVCLFHEHILFNFKQMFSGRAGVTTFFTRRYMEESNYSCRDCNPQTSVFIFFEWYDLSGISRRFS